MEQVTIPAAALDWLFNGETGASSQVMCARFLGVNLRTSWCWYPADAGDFGRCLKLLDAVPEWRGLISEMASVTPAWAALTACWDELTELFREGDYTVCTMRIRKALKDMHTNNQPAGQE